MAQTWKINVWDPTRSTIKATYTNLAPGGILEPFRWTVDGYGTAKQLSFFAKPADVDIGPRDVIELLIGDPGIDSFFGYIVRSWNSDDPNEREYIALGLAEGLKQRFAPWKHYAYQDTGDIFRALAQDYGNPIFYSASLVVNSGYKLELTTPGAVDYKTVLDDVTKRTPGYVWGVSPYGYFFFKPKPTDEISIDFSSPGIRWLPVSSEEIITKVIGWAGYADDGDGKYTYVGAAGVAAASFDAPKGRWPLVATLYTDPEHATYLAEKAVAVSSTVARYGTDPEIGQRIYNEGRLDAAPGTACYTSAPGTEAAIFDDDPNSYYALGANDTTLGYLYIGDASNPASGSPLGFFITAAEFDYQLAAAGLAPGFTFEFTDSEDPSVTYPNTPVTWGLAANTAYTAQLYGGPPLNKFGIHVNSSNTTCDNLKIYKVRLWGVDMGDVVELGKSLIRKPLARPAEVVMDGFIEPVPVLRITNAPSGTITGEIEEWEYYWSSTRRTSVARLAESRPQFSTALARTATQSGERAVQAAAMTMKRL